MRPARPFPWSSLDALRREDLRALAGLRLRARSWIDDQGALAALAQWTGARIDVRIRRGFSGPPPRLDPGDVGVLLAPSDEPKTSHAILVVAESALAAQLVARSLKRAAPALVDPSQPASAALAGAVGALVVAACRRGGASGTRVLACGSAAQFARDLGSGGASLVGLSVTVLVDDDAFSTHVVAARGAVANVPVRAFDAARLSALGAMPLALPLVAAVSLALPSDLARLQPGDAYVPGAISLTHQASGWAGNVHLAAATQERGLRARLEPNGQLVLGDEVDTLAWTTDEETMSNKDALVEAVGEVPVVVRVEVGTVQLLAREWAALGPGDVLTFGRKIAEPVVLRVGGVEVARGELVDVEGDVGVRILSRTPATGAAS